jgi:hypothetical protein
MIMSVQDQDVLGCAGDCSPERIRAAWGTIQMASSSRLYTEHTRFEVINQSYHTLRPTINNPRTHGKTMKGAKIGNYER